MNDKDLSKPEPDYIRYDCGCCGHETLAAQHKNICPVCSHRPMSKTSLYDGEYVQSLLNIIAELNEHLQSAHNFIEETEAFGWQAADGILKCGDSIWNIDKSKETLNRTKGVDDHE